MKDFIECTKREKVERWSNAVRVLRALTPHQRRKHFNMGVFAMNTDCGTVGCAAGHCAFDPWFRRRGFAIDRRNIDEEAMSNGDWIGSAVDEFFGEDGSRRIFFDTTRRPVGTVIKEILGYIEELRRAEHG